MSSCFLTSVFTVIILQHNLYSKVNSFLKKKLNHYLKMIDLNIYFHSHINGRNLEELLHGPFFSNINFLLHMFLLSITDIY